MKWMAFGVLMALPALAADVNVTGAWSISGEVSGVAVNENCNLTQTDTVLKGSCVTDSGKYDVTGKIDGSTATFKHSGVYNGDNYVITFTGKLGADGAMTGTMDVDPFSVTGSFTAKKSAPAAAAPAQ